MITLSSISSGLKFCSVNHTSIYEYSESKVFKNKHFLGEISNNWPNESCWWSLLTILQCSTTNYLSNF